MNHRRTSYEGGNGGGRRNWVRRGSEQYADQGSGEPRRGTSRHRQNLRSSFDNKEDRKRRPRCATDYGANMSHDHRDQYRSAYNSERVPKRRRRTGHSSSGGAPYPPLQSRNDRRTEERRTSRYSTKTRNINNSSTSTNNDGRAAATPPPKQHAPTSFSSNRESSSRNAEYNTARHIPHSNGDNIGMSPSAIKVETNVRRLETRQKQIDIGKNTLAYDHYSKLVPKHRRLRSERQGWHPLTPQKLKICSKRAWVGLIKKWRRLLHAWSDVVSTDQLDPQTLCPLPSQTEAACADGAHHSAPKANENVKLEEIRTISSTDNRNAFRIGDADAGAATPSLPSSSRSVVNFTTNRNPDNPPSLRHDDKGIREYGTGTKSHGSPQVSMGGSHRDMEGKVKHLGFSQRSGAGRNSDKKEGVLASKSDLIPHHRNVLGKLEQKCANASTEIRKKCTDSNNSSISDSALRFVDKIIADYESESEGATWEGDRMYHAALNVVDGQFP
mmetsp:Transcript_12643/g.20250  ORF Transcript_12643/g.20250 Transcript_12643/m.20250 type:complete len:499 (-) Transcript_12643:81-1577(-)